MERMASLDIFDAPPRSLDALPDDVLLIVISYLTTAQSVSRLAAASQRLHRLVSDTGWRVFVRNCFCNLSIPPDVLPSATRKNRNGAGTGAGSGWGQLARRLTSLSCDWDRRAFVFHVYLRPGGRDSHQPWANNRNQRAHVGGRGGQHQQQNGGGFQTVPCHVIVDVHSQAWSRAEEETVVWGAGEDLVALKRRKYDGEPVTQRWRQHRGVDAGFTAGKDDVTSLSLLKAPRQSPQDGALQVLVGRASGDLRLLSTGNGQFGRTIRHFRPTPDADADADAEGSEQREIQAFDTHEQTDLLAAASKDRILFYPIHGPGKDASSVATDGSHHHVGNAQQPEGDGGATSVVEPSETLNLRDVAESPNFRFIRSLKFVNRETIAVGLNSSTEPLRYLSLTPAGIETLAAPNIAPHQSSPPSASDDFHLGTVRALLPIDASSAASGGGSCVLSAWDDGTVRLQDLRTPSAFDRVYQDHFEPTTPVNALASYGLERFVAGSARGPVLKIFDYRMSRGRQGGYGHRYSYTEALACSADAPIPQPRPPAITPKPLVAARPRCDHLRGGQHLCRWHALSRSSYYRPNCDIYLPKRAGTADAPIHSLARASDISSTLYVGLSGTLVEMNLRNSNSSNSSPSAASSSPFSDHHPHHPLHDPYHYNHHHHNNNGNSSSSGNGYHMYEYESSNLPLYQSHRATVNFIETGDGTALSDISQSQRMPIIRAQSERRVSLMQQHHQQQEPAYAYAAKRNRLDEWLQDPTDSTLE
ncbi:hypothetical protein SLS62_004883 [Diatrype stigma]|uniref:F-box domain-containing protein n=1 Tax=Diatrype stigma TaxID=117547 RepID=A0AAN9UQI6_9PEZI